MGIYTVRSVFYMLMIIISGGLFLYIILAGGMTWIKASNAGIIQFHKIFSRGFYYIYYMIVIASLVVSVLNFTESYTCRQVIRDSEAVGVQAFLAYEELPPAAAEEIEDPEFYIMQKKQEYLARIAHHRQNGFFYLFMGMLWFSMMMLNTGFITEAGYFPLGAQKPQKLLAEAKDGELQFYLMTKKKSSRNKPLLKIQDTPQNRKIFDTLLKKKIMKGN